MNSKNVKLIGLLAVLVGVYFLVDLTRSKGKSKSSKSELVNIDTTAVTQLHIGAKGKEVSLDKQEGAWKVKLPNGSWMPADQSSVNGVLGELSSIKPARLASKKQVKWKEYQVDSAGTTVKVYEGGKLALDIILGRFAMEGQRNYSTFVRLADEEEVYNVKDFMSFSVPPDANAYRNKILAKIKIDSISQLKFTYPSDSGFMLTQKEDTWMINVGNTDSAAVDKYLKSLSSLSSAKFFDEDFDKTAERSSVVIDLFNGDSVVINAYLVEGKWTMQSSENSDAWYQDESLFEKVFKSASDLTIK